MIAVNSVNTKILTTEVDRRHILARDQQHECEFRLLSNQVEQRQHHSPTLLKSRCQNHLSYCKRKQEALGKMVPMGDRDPEG